MELWVVLLWLHPVRRGDGLIDREKSFLTLLLWDGENFKCSSFNSIYAKAIVVFCFVFLSLLLLLQEERHLNMDPGVWINTDVFHVSLPENSKWTGRPQISKMLSDNSNLLGDQILFQSDFSKLSCRQKSKVQQVNTKHSNCQGSWVTDPWFSICLCELFIFHMFTFPPRRSQASREI